MYTRLKISLASGVFIILMLASWILNMGWLRVIGTFMLIPVIHSVAFFFGNFLSGKNFKKRKNVTIITVLSFITFIIPHLLIADFADIGESYLFFRLIENSKVAEITTPIGGVFFAVNIAMLICQYTLFFAYRNESQGEGRS